MCYCIEGKDPGDWSSKNIHLEDPFSMDVTHLTVGNLPDADMKVVKVLKKKGGEDGAFRTKVFHSNCTIHFKKHNGSWPTLIIGSVKA